MDENTKQATRRGAANDTVQNVERVLRRASVLAYDNVRAIC
jgi:hypothetical protein